MEPTPLPAQAIAASNAAVKAAIAKSQVPLTKSNSTSTSDDDDDEDDQVNVPMPGETPVEPRTPGLVDRTVFEDQATFNVKHPLHSTWQLWFDSASKQDKAKSWDDALVKVIAFDSVEEFWGLYNNIVPPSCIHANSNYYLFKEGIKPAWEDASNSNGGKFSVQLPRGKFSESIDNYWLYTMLAAIGEIFETPFVPVPTSVDALTTPTPAPVSPSLPTAIPDEITGVIISSRKAFYRINIWTRTSSSVDRERIENIGKQFKYGVLGFGELKISEKDKVSTEVEFTSHKDSQAKYGTKTTKWVV